MERVEVDNEVLILDTFTKDLEKLNEIRPIDIVKLKRQEALVRATCLNVRQMAKDNLRILKVCDKADTTCRMSRFGIDVAESVTPATTTAKPTGGRTQVNFTWEPTFYNGDPGAWASWWDVFNSTVHSNEELDNHQKSDCLQKCLIGKAKNSLGSLAATADNYETAIETLKERCANEVVLSQTYYAEIDNIRPATTLREQRMNLDQIKSIIKNLQALKEIAIENQRVIGMIARKFPRAELHEALMMIRNVKTDLNYTPDDLTSNLEKVVQTKEHAETFFVSERAMVAGTSSSFSTSGKIVKRPREDSIVNCIFCHGSHPSQYCKKYATLGARKAQLQVTKRCYSCMRLGHGAATCKNKRRCSKCNGPHHVNLCNDSVAGQRPNKRGKLIEVIFLQSFSCMVLGNKNSKAISVRGLLDGGSTYSYINKALVKNLGYPLGEAHTLQYLRFSENSAMTLQSNEVEVILRNSSQETLKLRMFTTHCVVGNITTAPPVSVVREMLESNLYYADYDLFKDHKRPLQILVGADNYNKLVNLKEVKTLSSGLFLLKSFFGWIPSGSESQYSKGEMVPEISKTGCLMTANKEVEKGDSGHVFDLSGIEQLWSLEVLGIENPNTHLDTDCALAQFHKTTFAEEDGRINVRFPWKNTRVYFSSNIRVATARLRSAVDKASASLLKTVHEHFKGQLKEGVIEKVPFCNLNLKSKENRIHYLPHRWLTQKEKLRIVYDASSKTKGGVSLNNLIYTGPNLTKNLVKILLNFRLNKIGLIADIEKAFLQISLNEVDRDVVRFLWMKDPVKPLESKNLEHLRLTRVPFGVNASPYLLNIVLTETLLKAPRNKWLLQCQDDFYVDNFVKSVSSKMDAMNIYENLTDRLRSIKMNLRDWVTNDKVLAQALRKEAEPKMVAALTGVHIRPCFVEPSPERGSVSTLAGNCSQEYEQNKVSVLGLVWNVNEDMLLIKINDTVSSDGTKRNLLRMCASIFDPLGLVAPCVLQLKLLIQTCWKLKYEWDKQLPDEECALWKKIYVELLPIRDIIIPRWCSDGNEQCSHFLHVFCDASKDAYACCAYIVSSNAYTLKKTSHLVYAKTRITPIKNTRTLQNPLTIPKLELLAVLIGKRMAQYLIANLSCKIKETILWTDATTVLQWLQSSELLSPFINNRIQEIRNDSNIIIKHVPSQSNPADIASRGMSANKLKESSLWWKGPKWLVQKKFWPVPPVNVQEYDSASCLKVTVLVTAGVSENVSLIENIENRWSCWRTQVKILRFVIQFWTRCRRLHLSSVELEIRAESLLIKEVQKKYYTEELMLLQKGKNVKNNLDLFLDEQGIIRCKGRLHYAKFPYEVTHPILMPRNSNVTFNYIKYIHDTNKHIGTSHVLAKLREKIWVVKGRAKVRSVIHKCYFCKFWEGGNYRLPSIPPLPAVRLQTTSPFLQIGLDYFGPLQIKDAHGAPLDTYVIIFTCLVTRAIHLELVPDLSGEHFLLAIKREVSLKRCPKLIISDNAKTFEFVQPMIGNKVHFRDHKIREYFDTNYVEWYFIPKYAPWFGGAYERLIGIVKRSLKKSYGHKLISYIECQTVLYEIADIVNSRPLTYVSAEERIEAITPNHLWKLGPTNVNVMIEPHEKPIQSETGSNLIENWEFRSGVLNAYWEAFRHLYLVSLRERHIVEHPKKKGTVPFPPAVGDVVLIEQIGTPRGSWNVGRIEQLDKRQAVAHVRGAKGLMIRSIRQLYPLVRVKGSEPETETEPDTVVEDDK